MTLLDEALARFDTVYARATASGMAEPNAMNLATVDQDGRPSSRIVLLKGFDRDGFVFYTNTRSRKGQALAAHGDAALCFFWHELHEQVRIEGAARPVADEEADDYFASRPRDSQLGAWASQQSEPLASRAELERRCAEIAERFPAEVPRPPHWGGYRLAPRLIEFWVAGEHRLHERTVYWREGETWRKGLLNP